MKRRIRIVDDLPKHRPRQVIIGIDPGTKEATVVWAVNGNNRIFIREETDFGTLPDAYTAMVRAYYEEAKPSWFDKNVMWVIPAGIVALFAMWYVFHLIGLWP